MAKVVKYTAASKIKLKKSKKDKTSFKEDKQPTASLFNVTEEQVDDPNYWINL